MLGSLSPSSGAVKTRKFWWPQIPYFRLKKYIVKNCLIFLLCIKLYFDKIIENKLNYSGIKNRIQSDSWDCRHAVSFDLLENEEEDTV